MSNNNEALYKSIGELIDQGEIEDAYRLVAPLAERDDPRALNFLGIFYEKGLHVPQDYETAFKLYTKSGALGEARGVCSVGLMYQSGYYLQQDYQRAFNCFKRSAEMGYAYGRYCLGWAYYYGQGVAQDFAEAFTLFCHTADEVPYAGYLAGMMCIHGIGISEDSKKGEDLLRSSALRGCDEAKRFLSAFVEAEKTVIISQQVLPDGIIDPFVLLNKEMSDGLAIDGQTLGFINTTKGKELCHTGRIAEYYLLNCIVNYLFYEAPPDEQHVYMAAQFVDAALPDHFGGISYFHRLMDMLRENENTMPSHPALLSYERFTALAGDAAKMIAQSLRARFDIIGDQNNIFAYISKSQRISPMANLILQTFYGTPDCPADFKASGRLLERLTALYKKHEAGETADILALVEVSHKPQPLKKAMMKLIRFFSAFENEYADAYANALKILDNEEEMRELTLLAFKYLEGDGVAEDTEKAVEMLTTAADAGDMDAIYCLAFLYSDGTAVKKDLAKSLAYYIELSDMGDPDGHMNAAYSYLYGTGTRESLYSALDYLELAAPDKPRARYLLGVLHVQRKLLSPDAEQGMAMIRSAAADGDDLAGYFLSVLDQGAKILQEYHAGKNVKIDHTAEYKAMDKALNEGGDITVHVLRLLVKFEGWMEGEAEILAKYYLFIAVFGLVRDTYAEEYRNLSEVYWLILNKGKRDEMGIPSELDTLFNNLHAKDPESIHFRYYMCYRTLVFDDFGERVQKSLVKSLGLTMESIPIKMDFERMVEIRAHAHMIGIISKAEDTSEFEYNLFRPGWLQKQMIHWLITWEKAAKGERAKAMDQTARFLSVYFDVPKILQRYGAERERELAQKDWDSPYRRQALFRWHDIMKKITYNYPSANAYITIDPKWEGKKTLTDEDIGALYDEIAKKQTELIKQGYDS